MRKVLTPPSLNHPCAGLVLAPPDNGRCHRRAALFAASKAQMVGRGGGNGHISAEDFRKHGLGFLAARAHLRRLANELGGGIADDKTFRFQQLTALAQELGAGHTVVFGPAHPHERAEIAEVGGGEEGIDKRVGYDVAVGVAFAAGGVIEKQPGNPTGLAGFDLVGVGRDADAGNDGPSQAARLQGRGPGSGPWGW